MLLDNVPISSIDIFTISFGFKVNSGGGTIPVPVKKADFRAMC